MCQNATKRSFTSQVRLRQPLDHSLSVEFLASKVLCAVLLFQIILAKEAYITDVGTQGRFGGSEYTTSYTLQYLDPHISPDTWRDVKVKLRTFTFHAKGVAKVTRPSHNYCLSYLVPKVSPLHGKNPGNGVVRGPSKFISGLPCLSFCFINTLKSVSSERLDLVCCVYVLKMSYSHYLRHIQHFNCF